MPFFLRMKLYKRFKDRKQLGNLYHPKAHQIKRQEKFKRQFKEKTSV